MRILVPTLLVFLLICSVVGGGFAWLGQRAPIEYSTTVEVEIAAEPRIVWQALTDISSLIDRYDDISEVELLEADDQGPVRWRVLRGDTSVVIYRRGKADFPNQLSILIDGGNMGIEGQYDYHLTPLDGGNGTALSAVETTQIDDFVLRAAFALAGGRDQVLKAQVAEVKFISEAQRL